MWRRWVEGRDGRGRGRWTCEEVGRGGAGGGGARSASGAHANTDGVGDVWWMESVAARAMRSVFAVRCSPCGAQERSGRDEVCVSWRWTVGVQCTRVWGNAYRVASVFCMINGRERERVVNKLYGGRLCFTNAGPPCLRAPDHRLPAVFLPRSDRRKFPCFHVIAN